MSDAKPLPLLLVGTGVLADSEKPAMVADLLAGRSGVNLSAASEVAAAREGRLPGPSSNSASPVSPSPPAGKASGL